MPIASAAAEGTDRTIPPRLRWRLHPGRTLLLAAVLLGGPACAGSVTADSVWDQNDARQRAMQQVPAGSSVTGTRCQTISVGMGNDRYRCTVEYQRGAEAAQPAPPAPAAAPTAMP